VPLAPIAAFHICKACPPAYKVFFKTARGAYVIFNDSTQKTSPRSLSAPEFSVSPCLPAMAEQSRGLDYEQPSSLDYRWTHRHRSPAAVAFAKKARTWSFAGRRDEAGEALVKELRSFGSEAEFINTDVRRR